MCCPWQSPPHSTLTPSSAPPSPLASPSCGPSPRNTLFGGFARGGTSAALGNNTDASLIAGLRDWADVILVGAGTVAAESYGPANTPMAVVSRSLELEPSLEIFRGSRLMVLAPESSLVDAQLRPRAARLTGAGAEVHSTGEGKPADIVATLRGLGFQRILCEGGPSLYAAMLDADLIDVLHLTLDPTISNQDGPFGLKLAGSGRYTRAFSLDDATVDADSTLFCRYRRVPGGNGNARR